MSFKENFRLAWRCIKANKMRSFLTMLGIIIGISAVITISTIGTSLRSTIEKSITSLAGTNQIIGYMNSYEYMTAVREEPEGEYFPLETVKEMREELSDYISAVSVELGLGSTEYKTENGDLLNISVEGELEGFAVSSNQKMLSGRDLTIKDGEDGRAVCLVSDLFAKYAFGDVNPIGQKIAFTVRGISFELYIIGIYKYEAQGLNVQKDKVDEKKITTSVVMPYEYISEKLDIPKEDREVEFLRVYTQPGVPSDVIKAKMGTYFKQNVLKPDSKWFFQSESLEEELGQINSILNAVTIAISVIAAISLIVGGIGVMNIMLVSVVERTREIGIRKALGAKNKVIETQFLVEAVLLCAIGGVIGILSGILNGGIIAIIVKSIVAKSAEYSFLTVVVRPSLAAIIISFVFSSLVGVVFGLYPARRAARLSPIDALRYE